MQIDGASTALYATWLHLPELRLLIDAGDGAAAALRSACKQINCIAITHPHRDHIAGLLEVLSWSAFERPCPILYPAASSFVEAIRDGGAAQGVPCAAAAEWIPMRAGQTCELPGKPGWRLTAFAARHEVRKRSDLALGYGVLDGDRLRLAVTGDCRADPLELPGRPAVLVRDCTYLRPEDAANAPGGAGQHGVLESVLDAALAETPHHLVLYHLSAAYIEAAEADGIAAACRERGVPFPVSVLWPHRPTADVTARPVWTPP
jgi:ribonuclease BN (tRNA processing enzyme)